MVELYHLVERKVGTVWHALGDWDGPPKQYPTYGEALAVQRKFKKQFPHSRHRVARVHKVTTYLYGDE